MRAANISDWRRKTFGDMTSAFRFGAGQSAPPVLPDTSGPLTLTLDEAGHLPRSRVPSPQTLPVQEKGSLKRVSGRQV